MRRKCLIAGFLILFPLVVFSKFCPSCFTTFKVQTIRGQANLIYQWMVHAMNPKYTMQLKDLKQLYTQNIRIVVNGSQKANSIAEAYRYFLLKKQSQTILEEKLQNVIVDQQKAALQYQFILQIKQKKYRVYAISILNFKDHKVDNLETVLYTRPIS